MRQEHQSPDYLNITLRSLSSNCKQYGKMSIAKLSIPLSQFFAPLLKSKPSFRLSYFLQPFKIKRARSYQKQVGWVGFPPCKSASGWLVGWVRIPSSAKIALMRRWSFHWNRHLAFSMFEIMSTPKGQRLIHTPHCVHSEAWG
jgi:hypothetical protein